MKLEIGLPPEVLQAVQRFEAHQGGPSGEEAARNATRWLRENAIDDQSSVTRILLIEGEVVAYFTMSSGSAEISSETTRSICKWLGPKEIGASHIHWIARSEDAPEGAAEAAVFEAARIAAQLATEEGKEILTLDPYDEAMAEMWRSEFGFEETDSPATTGQDLKRLYVPLPEMAQKARQL